MDVPRKSFAFPHLAVSIRHFKNGVVPGCGWLRQYWENLTFQSKLAIVLVGGATVPLIAVVQGSLTLSERNFLAQLEQTLRKDLTALADEVSFNKALTQAEAANLANQVEVADVDLNNPQSVSLHRPLLSKAVNTPRASFVLFTDSKGSSIIQNNQILVTNFSQYPPLPEKGMPASKPQYRPVTVPPGVNFASVPIVKHALTTGRSLAGTELIKGKVLQDLGLAEQAGIGLRPQLIQGLSKAKQPFPIGTYDIDQGRMGLVIMAVHPVKVNNQVVGAAIVGTLLNRNYEIVDRIKQNYHVPTVTIFAQDWRVSTNVPYMDGKTRAIGTRVSREVAETVLNRGQTFTGQANIVGSNYRTSYSPLYDHRKELNPNQAKPVGILYVGEPEQAVADSLFKQQLISYSIGGGMLLLVSVLSMPIASSIARPLRHLTRFAQQVGTGEWGVRLDATDRQDEVGILTRELNDMATRIETNLEAAQQAEEQYRSIFENATEGIFQTTPDGRYIKANPALARIYGYESPEELIANLSDIGQQLYVKPNSRAEFLRLMQQDGAVSEFESQVYRKDGSKIWISENARAVYDKGGALSCYEGSIEDITERKQAQEQLRHNAFHDTLTGLPNRALFMNRLEQTVQRAKRHEDYLCAVLFLDLDRFKVVNDSLGHLNGDQLLITIARRLEMCLRTEDTVARLGGDEFAILLNEIKDVNYATCIAERIQQELARPFTLNGHEVFTSASIGIVWGNKASGWLDDLVRNADIAMYQAKAQGKARYEVFGTAMRDQSYTRLRTETDLRQAVERQEFRLHYQPIVALQTGIITGFEALVRWEHPTRSLISPAEFIPVAEETGLIVPLGQWVLQEACRQMQEWQVQFPLSPPLTISVNLSVKQFTQLDLTQQVAQILRETNLDAGSLRLEITESVLIDNAESVTAVLWQLKALGVLLSLDDFGTGYSSLNYLHRFPIDCLKIDRSFISRMGFGDKNSKIVQAITLLAKVLDIEVIAEGIETVEQQAQLSALHCNYGQGYLFSRPLNSATASALISRCTAGGQRTTYDVQAVLRFVQNQQE